jgi:hypothetical protein
LNRFTGITFLVGYSNRENREAFNILWQQLFKVVKAVTGRSLLLREFFPDDPTARLFAILVDGDVAQAQGLGDALMTYVSARTASDGIRSSLPTDPMQLALLVLKFCFVHFRRYVSDFSLLGVISHTID